ncbi:hypothetical protein D7027_05695 [Ochrobactrum intermedium]|jgi:hypothetical protein|uniref:hypothetical protein n=1 Tax=Brucella intermedia TaxID=94625 RepID=UPI00128CAA1C|nr:hypothetical protein [Brucella intermedia]MPR61309.1 hypothetical protein [Brucella intermedia]
MSKTVEEPREKTLHELNMEQRAINQAIKEANKDDPLYSLPEPVRRAVAKRMQKPARAPIKAD